MPSQHRAFVPSFSFRTPCSKPDRTGTGPRVWDTVLLECFRAFARPDRSIGCRANIVLSCRLSVSVRLAQNQIGLEQALGCGIQFCLNVFAHLLVLTDPLDAEPTSCFRAVFQFPYALLKTLGFECPLETSAVQDVTLPWLPE